MSVKDEIRAANKRSAAVQTGISRRLIKLSGKERQLSEQKAQLFEDFAGGSITRERYIEAKSALAAELDKIKTRKAELESKERSFEPVSETNHVIGLLEKLGGIQEVTPEIASFVKRITIFNSERIEIRFTFADELERLGVFANTTTNDYSEVM
jgi:hypothetical protein